MTVEPGTLKVNYANETSKALIRTIEHLLPIKAHELIGTSIDVFHKQPQHQRRILADPGNLPYAARIQLGPEVLDLKVSAVMDTRGSYIGPMLTWALVTKEVEAENRIRQLAHYDMLTGLPNRVTFHGELSKSLASPGSPIALLLVDLDGFKLVNDTCGHQVGDILLGQVAVRLRILCADSAMMLGRIGGDEFAILMQDGSPGAATAFAERMIGALSAPYDLTCGRGIELGASVGIALALEHGVDMDLLLRRADMALYAAKAAGRGRALVFSPEMEVRAQERAQLELGLRTALDLGEGLFVFYQPIVDLGTGYVSAREALLRWHHPQKGWVPPSQFIPVAEQSGLIDWLGAFVLCTACCEAAQWQDGARVAVNVSANQLGKGMLAPSILSALVKSGLSPDRLEIEVTETALFGSEQACIDDLRRLRDMGVRVALDDFGTGYSSLSHLQLFPFDKIKIDRSFVANVTARSESGAVIRAVADIGRRLGVTTVAEGVETQEQLDRVREEGCQEVQGYLFGGAVPHGADVPAVAGLKNRSNVIIAITS
jgi:diguanylate cyclase (GGDEF)-like protein